VGFGGCRPQTSWALIASEPLQVQRALSLVVAKAAGNATDQQMKLMVRTLLAERFHMNSHHESREISAIVISLGKGEPKLFAPKDGENRSLRIAPQTDPDRKIASYRVIATRFSGFHWRNWRTRLRGNSGV
jgi:uncharacterized protein (TIGR03435 family)